MRKILALVICLTMLLSALLISGCTPGGEEVYVEEGATEIKVYAREFEQWAKDHLNNLANEFNKDLTDGIQVKIQFYTQDTYADALTVARENGKAPDLYMTTYGELYTNIQNNYCISIDEYLSTEAVDDILDVCKEMVTYNDSIYAYPWNMEPGSMFFYRKDLFAEAGIEKVPTSWEELYDACEKLSGILSRGQYCIGLPLGSYECTWVTYGMQQNTTGGLTLDESWRVSRLDEPGFKDIAEFFYTIFFNDWAPTSALTSEGYTYIVDALCDNNPKLAMTFGGSWSIAEIYNYTESDQTIIDNIGVAPIPTQSGDQTGTTSANGGWCYCISKQSKNADKAAKFLNWMFTENAERTAQYFIEAYNSKAPTSQSVKDYLDGYNSEVPQEWIKVVNDVAATGIPEATYPWDISLETGKIFETMQVRCKTGAFETLYATALQTAQENIEIIMSRSNYPSNPKYDYGD